MAVHRPTHQGRFFIRVGSTQSQHNVVELFAFHNAFHPDLFNALGLAYSAQVRLSAIEGGEPPHSPDGERTMGIVPDPARASVSDCRENGVGMGRRYVRNQGV
jgi:hypothetical protein